MESINKHILLDLWENTYVTISPQQYDRDLRTVTTLITDEGNPYYLDSTDENLSVRICCEKPDGTHVYNDCIINEDGTVSFTITEQMLSAEGKIISQLELTDISDFDSPKVIKTKPFKIIVDKSVLEPGDVTSSYEFNALNELIIKAEIYGQKSYEAIEKIEETNDKVEVAESTRINSENERNNSEINRNNRFNTMMEDNSDAIENVQTATNAAITASKNANDATAESIIATTNANVSTENANTATVNATNAANTAVQATNECINAKEQTIVATESCKTSIENANQAINSMTTLENNVTANENVRITNEVTRQNAETKRQLDTTTAISDANTAASNANIAADRANEAAQGCEDVIAGAGFVKISEKGVANGVATLDENGTVPSSQLPSFVDDVLEFNALASFPSAGETGKIYVATDTNKTYRWTGTTYTVISDTIALGETSSTAYRGDRGKTAYDHSQTSHAPSNAQANVIETVSVNGTNLVPSNKKVNLTVPTKTSQLQNDSGFVVNSGVTGVKGNSETAYRTGNVNITPTNIGLGNVNNTADANKTVMKAGTADTASKLVTARKINNVAFDGTQDITISAVPTSGASNYMRVFNSQSVGSSTEVTFNDLASQHFATGMIYSATDNPLGTAGWCHAMSLGWLNGSNSQWISQLAVDTIRGVNSSLYFRSSSSNGSGTIVGSSWKKVLDSNNYTSYVPTKTGSGASGTWGINVTGSAASCSGNSATATALNTNAGSTVNPVYFSGGKPVACTPIVENWKEDFVQNSYGIIPNTQCHYYIKFPNGIMIMSILVHTTMTNGTSSSNWAEANLVFPVSFANKYYHIMAQFFKSETYDLQSENSAEAYNINSYKKPGSSLIKIHCNSSSIYGEQQERVLAFIIGRWK